LEFVRKSWPKIARAILAAGAALLIPSLNGIARAAAPARLTFVGTDSNIYECIGDCAKPQCLTCPVPGTRARAATPVSPAMLSTAELLTAASSEVARGRPEEAGEFDWPTYSPDGSKIAYVSASSNPQHPSFGVYVYDLNKRISTRIFESATERGIYLFWLADGRLSFLVTEPEGKLSLMLAEVREDPPVRIVETGAPLFFDWNHKTGELLLHANAGDSGRAEFVSLIKLTPTDQDVERVLARGRSPFKTPCWSPDGNHLAFVASQDDIAHLYVADPAGRNAKAMAKLMVGEASFVWARDSRHIAFSSAQLPPYNVMDGISILDIGDGSVRTIVKDDVAAFYFSPDSSKLAWVSVPPEKPFYTLNVCDLRSGKTRRLGSFLTTNEELLAWRYFEQLALSHSIWAPDSSALVFAGVPVTRDLRERKPESTINTPPPTVTVIPADGKAPRAIAEGTLAFWAPAQTR
jgi:Tol biopolymer transport system component